MALDLPTASLLNERHKAPKTKLKFPKTHKTKLTIFQTTQNQQVSENERTKHVNYFPTISQDKDPGSGSRPCEVDASSLGAGMGRAPRSLCSCDSSKPRPQWRMILCKTLIPQFMISWGHLSLQWRINTWATVMGSQCSWYDHVAHGRQGIPERAILACWALLGRLGPTCVALMASMRSAVRASTITKKT